MGCGGRCRGGWYPGGGGDGSPSSEAPSAARPTQRHDEEAVAVRVWPVPRWRSVRPRRWPVRVGSQRRGSCWFAAPWFAWRLAVRCRVGFAWFAVRPSGWYAVRFANGWPWFGSPGRVESVVRSWPVRSGRQWFCRWRAASWRRRPRWWSVERIRAYRWPVRSCAWRSAWPWRREWRPCRYPGLVGPAECCGLRRPGTRRTVAGTDATAAVRSRPRDADFAGSESAGRAWPARSATVVVVPVVRAPSPDQRTSRTVVGCVRGGPEAGRRTDHDDPPAAVRPRCSCVRRGVGVRRGQDRPVRVPRLDGDPSRAGWCGSLVGRSAP